MEKTFFHKNKIVSDEKQLAKLLNSYNKNIVEKNSGINQKPLAQILKTVCSQLEILSVLTKINQAL